MHDLFLPINVSLAASCELNVIIAVAVGLCQLDKNLSNNDNSRF